jgi:ABC-type transport system involved in cytochrome c biogenesis permease subunit
MKTIRSQHAALLAGLLALLLTALPAWAQPNANRDLTLPNTEGFDLDAFGEIPVLTNGRISPLSSVARNNLLILQNKGRVTLGADDDRDAPVMNDLTWLAEVLFDQEKADQRPIFLVYHPDVLSMLDQPPANKHRFSFNELLPYFEKLQEQATMAREIESKARTPYQTAVVNLHQHIGRYHGLKNSIKPLGITLDELLDGIRDGSLKAMVDATAAGGLSSQDLNTNQQLAEGAMIAQALMFQSENGLLFMVPPPEPDGPKEDWQKMGNALMMAAKEDESLNMQVAEWFATIGDAWRSGEAGVFNKTIAEYQAFLNENHPKKIAKSEAEHMFNVVSPFMWAMVVYVAAFVLAAISWLVWPRRLGSIAFWLMIVGLVLHTTGLFWRMWLEGRPPVTNLYSSAVFIGWGSILLGIALERVFRNGIGTATATMTGFATLLVARQLSLDGDTLQMMQAVLDSNFWLATHVVIITLGYSAMFLAGAVGALYIVLGVFTRIIDKVTAKNLARMVYGIICFATLFSTVGTLLGGWWADQSWGRFWGWDPKENGALMIVLWCAIILHSRWGGLVKERGLMILAVFGNIITTWSWFGTNLLGVGLHSYGFTEEGFIPLVSFVALNIVIMLLGLVPIQVWRSMNQQKEDLNQPVEPRPAEA